MNSQNQEFVAPILNWLTLMPVIVVLGMATLSVLVSAFLPRAARWGAQVGMTILGLVGALVALAWQWPSAVLTSGESASSRTGQLFSFFVTRDTIFLQGSLVLLALISVIVMAERTRSDETFTPSAAAMPGSDYEKEAASAGLTSSEAFSLMLFAVGGMMAFVAAGDFLTMFVALEVFSLPLYILCGLAARRRLISQEASLKYFVLGAFSSAIFLFGMAFMYVRFGTLNLIELNSQAQRIEALGTEPLVIMTVLLILVGLFFKLGAAPFHTWTPDVYEGSPTPVTGFMAACTKIAAFGALTRVLLGLIGFGETMAVAIAVVATMSMVVGVVVAIRQSSVKRMLAYSSVAHAGFILTAMTVMDTNSINSVNFYLFVYGVTTVGTFALLSLVRERTTDGGAAAEALELDQWKGLGKRSPLLAGTLTVFLLATAGIPLTSGFMGKFAVFKSAVENDVAWLAVVGVLASAVAAYFYIRIIVTMWTPADDMQVVSIAAKRPLTSAVVTLCLLVTVGIGVYPTPVLDVIQDTSSQPAEAQQQR